MKHSNTNNKVLKAIAICFILIWTSSSLFSQSGTCDTTRITFTGEGLPIGFDSGELRIESIQLPFPTLIEVADSNEVYVFGGQPVALDIVVNAILTGQPGQLLGYFHRASIEEARPVYTKNLTITNNFKVAPNPFRNETLITWDNATNATYQAQLLNLTGQVVRRYQNVQGESLLIEKRDLLPGIYFLNMVDEAGNLGTLKLLVQE